MKYGLALEGGGAKGAYQVGAIKALIENGYEFSSACGTSIGAINAALLAQGDFDKLYEMWKNMSFKDLFDLEEDKIKSVMQKNINLDVMRYLSKKLGSVIKDGGLDITKMRNILEMNIDEEKIRKSDTKFGLVTVCLTDKSAEELFIDDIAKGKLIDYLMASSNLPVFQRMKIDNKSFLDGGIYDNCPVHMLEKNGYTDIIVIRAYKRMRIRDYKNIIKRNKVKLIMIEPIDVLPSILNFDTENLNELLKLGYFDALRTIKKLDGYRYYVCREDEDVFMQKILDINSDEIKKIAKLLKLPFNPNSNMKKLLLETIIPQLIYKTRTKEADTYKETLYALVEYVAQTENIDRFTIYNKFDDLLSLVKEKISYNGKNQIDEAIYRLINNI